MHETVQAEAIPPEELNRIVARALEEAIDLDALADVQERSERAQLVAELNRLRGH